MLRTMPQRHAGDHATTRRDVQVPLRRLGLPAGLAAVQLILAYEWLISGINSFNYFLQGGSALPWVNPANAFGEGVDIDVLIPLLSVTLLTANLRAVRTVANRFTVHQPKHTWIPWAS